MVRMTRSENGMYFGDEHDEKENALLTPLNGKAMGFELLHLLPVKVSRQVDSRFSRNFCGGCTLAMIKAKEDWSEIISVRAEELILSNMKKWRYERSLCCVTYFAIFGFARKRLQKKLLKAHTLTLSLSPFSPIVLVCKTD